MLATTRMGGNMDFWFILSALAIGVLCGIAVTAIWMGEIVCDGLCGCPPWDEKDDHLLDEEYK